MVLYLSGNFPVFKDLALWVVLVYGTQSKNSQYNNARFMHKLYGPSFVCMSRLMHKLYIFLCNVTNRLMMGGGYSLYHIEKLKDFTDQFKSGLIPIL